MGRSDTYRFELVAQPGWSKRAARYDVGLAAHTQSRPAHTSTSPSGSPSPAPHSLPSSALAGNSNSTPYRHTRYDALNRLASEKDPGNVETAHTYDAVGRRLSVSALTSAAYYFYDPAGRMEHAKSGLTAMGTAYYEFEAASRLTKKTLGNACFAYFARVPGMEPRGEGGLAGTVRDKDLSGLFGRSDGRVTGVAGALQCVASNCRIVG